MRVRERRKQRNRRRNRSGSRHLFVVTRRFVDAIAKCGRVHSTRAPRVNPKQTREIHWKSSVESAGKEVFCDVARARRLRRWTREGRIS